MSEYPTSIGTSDESSIQLLGDDLAGDLMGQVGFAELAFWLVAMRRPTPGELRVFETVLVALADHGYTPSAIAARLTLTGAPESVQGALAAGLLGRRLAFPGGDRGRRAVPRGRSSPDVGQGDLPDTDDGVGRDGPPRGRNASRAAGQLRARSRAPRAQGRRPAHARADPRLPSEEGLRGPHLRLFEAIGRVHPAMLGRTPAAQRRRRLRGGTV